MKRECKFRDGDYQVWSGRENPQSRGTYIIYWRGIEIGRDKYLSGAQLFIRLHKHNQESIARHAEKQRPLKPETEAWLDKLFK
jgi:hypothetical protein